MAKDIGMPIRKGIVVPFLPCLVAFWGFHPYVLSFFLLLYNNIMCATSVTLRSAFELDIAPFRLSSVNLRLRFLYVLLLCLYVPYTCCYYGCNETLPAPGHPGGQARVLDGVLMKCRLVLLTPEGLEIDHFFLPR